MTDAAVALLRELVTEIRGLRADLAAAGDVRRVCSADRQWLSALLPELERIGAGILTAAELLRLADGRADLFALLAEYLDAGGKRRLGKRLARCAGALVDGRALDRIGADRGGALYSLRVSRQ